MIGGKCKAYVNTATYASPTWVEVTKLRNVTRTRTKAKGDVTGRGDPHKVYETAVPDISITGELVYKPGNAAHDAIADAEAADEVLDMCWMDAPGGAGSIGKRGDYLVSKFDRKEEMEAGVLTDVEFAPTDRDGHFEVDYTFPGGGG